MIFGGCPHCNKYVSRPIAQNNIPLPCYSKELCEHCGKDYWIKHSRISPEFYAEKPTNIGDKINDQRD